MRRTAQLWTLMAALVVAAFALRTLVLIDATALWSDELYSVGKSFQPSPLELLGMLRNGPKAFRTVGSVSEQLRMFQNT